MATDPVARLALALALILVGARLLGDLAERLRQPAVVGELVFGIVLGNLDLLGVHSLSWLRTDGNLDVLARLGVMVLLFEIGLGSTVREMLQVGLSSLLVAVLGVVAPLALGWPVGAWLLPDRGWTVHCFLGATLTATSVGITARVLSDLGRARSPEARIILGAAVIDDVLGLVVLAVVAAVIGAADRGASPSVGGVALIIGKAAGFLVGALVLGVLFSRRLFWTFSHLRTRGVLISLALAFALTLGWLADAIGLATIVGAFAAGLILEDATVRDFGGGVRQLEELVRPITTFLSPVFFVLMGARTELKAFAQPGALALAAALTLAAIVGKQACAAGVLGRGRHRLVVSIGMIPRGEVGLVFANLGLSLTVGGQPIVDPRTYAAVLLMVVVTTLLTPPALAFAARGLPPDPTTGPTLTPDTDGGAR